MKFNNFNYTNERFVGIGAPFLLGALTGGAAYAAFNPYRPRPYYPYYPTYPYYY